MNLAITIILGTAVVLLAVAAAIAVERIAAGPSQLDRSISSDLLVAVVIAAVGVWAVAKHQDTEIAMILLLSMLGFTGAISVARMVAERVVLRRSEDKQKEARK